MSSMNQGNNGKKTGSGGSSTVNTPASTPLTSMASMSNGPNATQMSMPLNNNAPKYGTLVPNRIFVGGISANTTEDELMQLFNNYGKVKAAKIIQDRAGVSKGYGFITFESEDDAKRLQRDSEDIVLKERKLNIAPAIKKQPFSRTFDGTSPPAVAAGNPAQFYFQPGTIPYFQSGVAYYPPPTAASADPNTQQPPMYQAPSVYPTQSGPPQTATYPPVIFPAQPMYMPQQYPMPLPYEYNYYPNGAPQYMVGGQGGPQSQVPPLQRPGSPPRQPCYGQQLPYNPDAMYYNVPVYGTMEGPALYPESLDMANGGIAEDAYPPLDNTNGGVQHHHPSQQHQDVDSIQHHSTDFINNTETHQNIDNSDNSNNTSATSTRQSNTPVVSLLSLDQHQEKDFSSMQGGRRRKLVTPPNNNNNSSNNNFNGFAANMPHQYNATNAPYYGNMLPQGNQFYHFNGAAHQGAYTPPFTHPNAGYNGKFQYNGTKMITMNGGIVGQPDRWGRKKRGGGNSGERRIETGSLSSLRTDSNSSASIADEQNRNEEKGAAIVGVAAGGESETPPPAPYSPMLATNSNNKVSVNAQMQRHYNQFSNSRNANRGGAAIGQHYNHYYNHRGNYNGTRNFNKNNNNNIVFNRSVSNAPTPAVSLLLSSNQIDSGSPNRGFSDATKMSSTQLSSAQVHPSGASSATPPQHFAPPMRRPRRPTRRAGQSLSEIGAGDAPLPPNSDVADACKKLEGLKL